METKETSVFIESIDNGYHCINTICLDDTRLSWKAKGIHTFLITKPGKEIKAKDLEKISSDGESSVRSGIAELIRLKYLYRIVRRGPERQIINWGYLILESPMEMSDVKRAIAVEKPRWEVYERRSCPTINAPSPENLSVGNLSNRSDQNHLQHQDADLSVGNPRIHTSKQISTITTSNLKNLSVPNGTSRSFNFDVDTESATPQITHQIQNPLMGGNGNDREHQDDQEEDSPHDLPSSHPVSPAPLIRKLHRAKDAKSPLLTSAKNGINEIFQEQSDKIKAKRKQNPLHFISQDIRIIMEHWEESGFKSHDPQKAPNSYNHNIRSIKKVMDGRLILSEKRKFTEDDIISAIDTFSLIVFNDSYGPEKHEVKAALAKMSIANFLYSPHTKSTIKSWFIKCIDQPLKKREEEKLIEDKHPVITRRLMGFYCRYVLGGIKKNFSVSEQNKFRLASNKLEELYNKKGHMFVGVTDGLHEMGDILCKSIRDCYGENTNRVYPGSFCSSFAFSRMVAYANNKGYMQNEESAYNDFC